MADTKVFTELNVEGCLESIRKRIKKAENYFFDLQASEYGPDDESYRVVDEAVASENMLDAWLLIITLFEKCNHQALCNSTKVEFEECKKDPLKSDMGYDDPYLVWGSRAYALSEIFEDLHFNKSYNADLTSTIDLANVIQNMERYITSRAIFGHLPRNEDDVHNRIEKALECIYSDVRHKPPISKRIKGFEGDTGLPGLSTLIEYKYVDSPDAKKQAFEQILADIGGYQCKEYKNFVFVMYETMRFSNEDEWKSAIEDCNPPSPIEVILLKGSPPLKWGRKGSGKTKSLKARRAKPAG